MIHVFWPLITKPPFYRSALQDRLPDVGAGLGLGHRDRLDPPGDDPAQDLLLLLLGAEALDAPATIMLTAKKPIGISPRVELLEQQAQLDHAAAGAAVLLRDRDAEPAELGDLLVDSWLCGSWPSSVSASRCSRGAALAAGEVADRLDEGVLLVGQGLNRHRPARLHYGAVAGRLHSADGDPPCRQRARRRRLRGDLRPLRPRHRDLASRREPARRQGDAARIAPPSTHPWLVARRRTARRLRLRRPHPGARRLPVDDRGQRVRRPGAPAPRRRPALYEALFRVLAEQGYRVARAVIGLPNTASVALHEAFGFGRWACTGARLQARRLVGRRLVAARPRRRGSPRELGAPVAPH